jgi:hypothetical protein
MATSEWFRFVDFSDTQLDSLDPCDTGLLRQVIGNLDHLADQYAQVRVAWELPTDAPVAFDTSDTESVEEAVPYRLWTSCPFDLHVLPDGTTYPCRVSLKITSGSDSDAATFRAVMTRVGAGDGEHFEDGPNATEIAITHDEITWHLADDLIYLDSRARSRATVRVPTINAPGGTETSALWLRVTLTVWVTVNDSTSIAALRGVELHEYIPPDP